MKCKTPWWQPIIDTATHVVVASALFIVIALPALGLSFLVKWMETMGLPDYTLAVFTVLEYIIVTIDAAAVLFYIGSMIYKHLKGPDDDNQT